MADHDKHRFTVRFWGVRGSIPTPGHATQAVGGNTSCIEIRVDDEVIILDAGSGLRSLGLKLAKEKITRATFLISHVHWDHILGFPYFVPATNGSAEFVLFGERKAGAGVDDILDEQARMARAPLVTANDGARIQFEAIGPKQSLKVGKAEIHVARMNHPDGCVAFTVTYKGHKIVYATDTEHIEDRIDPNLVTAASDADMLIYDAMYTEEEYRGEVGASRKGWGHSTWNAGVKVAEAAGVKRLFLFHHEPLHDDRFIERIEKDARREFSGAIAAREGMSFNPLTGRVSRAKLKLSTYKKPAPGIARKSRHRT